MASETKVFYFYSKGWDQSRLTEIKFYALMDNNNSEHGTLHGLNFF